MKTETVIEKVYLTFRLMCCILFGAHGKEYRDMAYYDCDDIVFCRFCTCFLVKGKAVFDEREIL